MLKRSRQGPRLPEPIELDPESEAGLAAAVVDTNLDRNFIVELIVKDWLIAHGYVQPVVIDDDSETVGTA